MLNQNVPIDNLIERFKAVRNQTMALIKPLKIEDMVVQPVIDVSPPKWHLAHTTWFFETFLLKPYSQGYQEYNPLYSFLFNSYYQTLGQRVQRDQRGFQSRPLVTEIIDYRNYVDEAMERFIKEATQDQISMIILGIHHEQQHQELLVTDIKYILGSQVLQPGYGGKHQNIEHLKPLDWLDVDAGTYSVGFNDEGFCFDNEQARHTVWLEAFQIGSRVVSAKEYVDFMNDKGYQRSELWLSDGWDWVQNNNRAAPLYWCKQDDRWHWYSLSGSEPVNLCQPISHINFYEADAFARWQGKRLPTEFEWEIAASLFEPNLSSSANFLESGTLQPVYNGSAFGFYGSVWEWTNSSYLPYPGYQQNKGALGEYNGKFMVNQMVLKGGSCATPATHFKLSYRNFFQPEKQWQFSGLRLAETLN